MRLILSGSSSGIGLALAEHLLSEGHEIWGLARSDQSHLATRLGARFHPAQADVSDWEAVARIADQVRSAAGSIDGIIACAGLQGEVGPAMSVDPVKWSATVRANLDGTFYLVRAFHGLLHPQGRGKVICFSGGGATKSRVNFSAYGVAKTGVVRLVETLAEEWQGSPIDINAIAPGAINTRLTEEVLQLGPDKVGRAEYEGALKQKQNGGASLERAIGLVEFLLSRESDGITGRLIAAPWDPWSTLGQRREALQKSDIFQLRRIVPEERGQKWSE